VPRARYRGVADRENLEVELTKWRDDLHANKEDLSQWPVEWILDGPDIALLARTKPNQFAFPSDITAFLSESDEWGQLRALDIWCLIRGYDQQLETRRKAAVKRKREEAKLKRAEMKKQKRRADQENNTRGDQDADSGDDSGQGVESEEEVASNSEGEVIQDDTPCYTVGVTRSLAKLFSLSRPTTPLSRPLSPSSTPPQSRPQTPQISSSLRRPRQPQSPVKPNKSPPPKRVRKTLYPATNTYSLRSRGNVTSN
jgi:hypothetical protein